MELKDKFSHWCSGSKQGVGAALSKSSFAHFTISNGILTETYFPHPDSIILHSFRFLINGKDESDFPSSVAQSPDAPIFDVKTDLENLAINKEIFADPFSSGIFLHYRFNSSIQGAFMFFPFPNNAFQLNDPVLFARTKNNTLTVKCGDKALLVKANFNFSVKKEGKLFFIIPLTPIKDVFIYIRFLEGGDVNEQFPSDLPHYCSNAKSAFTSGWKQYLNSLPLSGKSALYKQSIIVIKSAEDKIHSGATVASLAIPWGNKMSLSEQNGYHLVWVRDLFFTALAMLSAGDRTFAENALNYMCSFLMRADGSFKQNSTIYGEERWNATQMDQVAFPIILADKLKRTDLIKGILSKSAYFIAENGPWSEQERWEELSGYSVYTGALEARALEIFSETSGRKEFYTIAKKFFADVVKRTYTRSGIFGNGNYFVRISKGDADTGEKVILLKGKSFTPKEIVSNDFLYAVFTGMMQHSDPKIVSSLNVSDKVLRVDTPKGVSFYRYNHDEYGFDGSVPSGKLWVLLTAERGLFETVRRNFNYDYLSAIRHFATKTNLLPEQIFESGAPTESATPLLWSHAAFMLLEDAIFKEEPFSL